MKPSAAQSTKAHLLITILLIILASFNGVYKLDAIPLQDSDESRHGVSALEMLESRNFLINTYNHEADLWNAKPPLSFWLSASGYIVSPTVFGLRSPSVLISLATIFITVAWTWKRISPTAGIGAGFILSTIPSFFLNHNVRTADPDALYIFFSQCAMLAALETYYNHKRTGILLSLAALCTSFAFLTKSWHAASVGIGIIGIAITTIGFRRLLIHLAPMIVTGLAPTAFWVFLRYSADGMPFFNTMIYYDLLKRSSQSIEGHPTALFFYVDRIVGTFPHWFSLIIILSLLTWYYTHKMHSKIRPLQQAPYLGIAVFAATIFLLFTAATSKLAWYIYPMYPAASMLIASAFVLLQQTVSAQRLGYIPLLLFAACIIVQETRLVSRVHHMASQVPLTHQQIIALAQDKKNHGKLIQITCGSWTQSAHLTAKIYGNFTPVYDETISAADTLSISNCNTQ